MNANANAAEKFVASFEAFSGHLQDVVVKILKGVCMRLKTYHVTLCCLPFKFPKILQADVYDKMSHEMINTLHNLVTYDSSLRFKMFIDSFNIKRAFY